MKTQNKRICQQDKQMKFIL